jgi:hypothetical protein
MWREYQHCGAVAGGAATFFPVLELNFSSGFNPGAQRYRYNKFLYR